MHSLAQTSGFDLRHLGQEFLDDPRLSNAERLYIRLLGIPISGLRIRLRRILPQIEKLDIRFQKILDVGCGKGIFTFELAKRFPQATVVGIDTDREQIEINRTIAKKHGFQNLRFEATDILELADKGTYDLVLSVDALEHIEDDLGALRVMRSAARPGGVFVCHVPAFERIWIFRNVKTNFDVPGHVRPGYRLNELTEKLKTSGFQVLEAGHTYGYLETVSNNLSYLITGASQKNKAFYALAFPLLNAVAWIGKNQDPGLRGAGVLAIAKA
jgi:ubiquinone/menaquinone biosynthesis C-methylase UbiE